MNDLDLTDDDVTAIYPGDLAAVGISLSHVSDYSDDDGNAGSVLALSGRNVAFYDYGDGWAWVSRTPGGTKVSDGWAPDKGNLIYTLARHARLYGYPSA